MANFGGVIIGLVVILPGVYIILNPYKSANFRVRLDSIGSNTDWEDVEPKDWMIHYTRIIGGLIALMGMFMIYISIY
jgi:hypothetical protein